MIKYFLNLNNNKEEKMLLNRLTIDEKNDFLELADYIARSDIGVSKAKKLEISVQDEILLDL
jgi:hypothetical protein